MLAKIREAAAHEFGGLLFLVFGQDREENDGLAALVR